MQNRCIHNFVYTYIYASMYIYVRNNRVYISFIYKECKYIWYTLNN